VPAGIGWLDVVLVCTAVGVEDEETTAAVAAPPPARTTPAVAAAAMGAAWAAAATAAHQVFAMARRFTNSPDVRAAHCRACRFK
jgi:hypothetical protein